jgi:hypothetical protein
MQYAYDLGGGIPVVKTVKLGAAVNAGVVVMHDTSHVGNVIAATVSAAVDSLGLAVSSGTYTATPSATSPEGTAEVVMNPFAVIRARVSGSATAGANFATTHLFTQTAASTTVITSAAVPAYTANAGGTIFCLSGVNKGQSRVVTSHVDSTSVTVTVPFLSSVAVGDKLVAVPYEIGSENVYFTTDFQEIDSATIEIGGSGPRSACVELQVTDWSSTAPQVYCYFLMVNSIWNPID